MQPVPLLDCAGRRRSPANLASFHEGHPPRNKSMRDPPDPPTVEEIIAVMRIVGDDPDGLRLRGLIVVLWRAGRRTSEALALSETDLDRQRGAIPRPGREGRKRREVGMDRWAWDQLEPWLAVRASLPVGALFCMLRGPTRGRPCAAAGVRAQLRNAAQAAGVRRRFAPHQLRHAHAVEMSREGPARCHPAATRPRRLGITSAYLRGIDNTEIIHTVHERSAPMIPAATGLRTPASVRFGARDAPDSHRRSGSATGAPGALPRRTRTESVAGSGAGRSICPAMRQCRMTALGGSFGAPARFRPRRFPVAVGGPVCVRLRSATLMVCQH